MSGRSRLTNVSLVFVLVLSMLSVGIWTPLAPFEDVEAKRMTVTTREDGNGTFKVSLIAGAPSGNNRLSIRPGFKALNASLDIRGLPFSDVNGTHPDNLTLDVGGDGTIDFLFNGLGYGEMGRQTYFIDDSQKTLLTAATGTESAVQYIRLPKGAKIVNASMDATATSDVSAPYQIGTAAAGSAWYYPFYYTGTNTNRQQWLYRGTEIPKSGGIDKIGWEWNAGSGTFTIGSGSMEMMGTSTAALTTTSFSSNWGGATAQDVFNGSYKGTALNYNGKNYMVFDLDYKFLYNNATNLLIDAKTTNKAGTQAYLRYISGQAWTMMCYNSGNTGNSISSCYTYRFNLLLYFFGALDARLDIFDDGTSEWLPNTAAGYSSTKLEFKNGLQTYLDSHPANGTDDYGVSYVDVPITVAGVTAGVNMTLSNMSIWYDYNATVRNRPGDNNLTMALNSLIPQIPAADNITIPLVFSTDSGGQVEVTNINITLEANPHAPILDSWTPTSAKVDVNESDTAKFTAVGHDILWCEYNFTWFIDNVFNATGPMFDYTPDYFSSGDHKVKVVMGNEFNGSQFTSIHEWDVVVHDVNRQPVIDHSEPEATITVKEGVLSEFGINASDPDLDPLSYIWTYDQALPRPGTNVYKLDLTENFNAQGEHNLKVDAKDPKGLIASTNWVITVENVNTNPRIVTKTPSDNVVSMKENATTKFSYIGDAVDGGTIDQTWRLDGNIVTTAPTYDYYADFDAAGNHTLNLTISDGELPDSREWTIKVINTDRKPVAVIDDPVSGTTFREGMPITLKGTSSWDPDKEDMGNLKFKWTKGALTLSEAAEATIHLDPGKHDIKLEVTDPGGMLSSTTVTIEVSSVDLFPDITFAPEADVKENASVKVNYSVRNEGKIALETFDIILLLDGKQVEKKTITTLDTGAEAAFTYSWKAVAGDHTFTLKAMEMYEYNKTITVAENGGGGGGGGGGDDDGETDDGGILGMSVGGIPVLVLLVLIIVIVVIGAVAASRGSKKPKPAQTKSLAVDLVPTEPQPAAVSDIYAVAPAPVSAPVSQDAAYVAALPKPPSVTEAQMAQVTAPLPAPTPEPAYAPVAANVPTPAPVTTTAAAGDPALAFDTHGILSRAHEAVTQAYASGKDVTRAQANLKIAYNFYEKKNFAKAMDFAEKAMASLN